MSILNRFASALYGSAEPEELDFVPIAQEDKQWQQRAIQRAAARHGKPFRCGPDGVAREVMRNHCSPDRTSPYATIATLQPRSSRKVSE